jgi:hypothetical protein
MIELITNLHIHTLYSDGSETHQHIASIAHDAGLDVLVITDHNVLVQGIAPYYEKDGRKLFILIGQEVHNPTRMPQKSHLLVFGGDRDLAPFGSNPQMVIDKARNSGALTFIAHPYEQDLPAFHQTDITWEDWQVEGFTGIELWNGFSEMKEVVRNLLDALFYVQFPQNIATSPPRASLSKWDELLISGKRVVAIGGSDAHAMTFKRGFLKRLVLPYEYHFQAINTHILVPDPLSGDEIKDKKMIVNAFRNGNAFVAYDLPAPTRGFRFMAEGKEKSAWMGDEIELGAGLTFKIRLPLRTRCVLIKDGKRLKAWSDKDVITQFIDKPGVYRVESYIQYLGKWRGWIYSNPIYVR